MTVRKKPKPNNDGSDWNPRSRIPKELWDRMRIIGEGAVEIMRKHNALRAAEAEAEKPSARRSSKKARGGSKRQTSEGFISLKELCRDFEIEPREARKLLRLHEDIQQHDGKWEFDPAMAEKVRSLLKNYPD